MGSKLYGSTAYRYILVIHFGLRLALSPQPHLPYLASSSPCICVCYPTVMKRLRKVTKFQYDDIVSEECLPKLETIISLNLVQETYRTFYRLTSAIAGVQ